MWHDVAVRLHLDESKIRMHHRRDEKVQVEDGIRMRKSEREEEEDIKGAKEQG